MPREDALALHDATGQLAYMTQKFNALVDVTSHEMAQYIKPVFMPAIPLAGGALAGALEARFTNKGVMLTAGLGLGAWVAAAFAGENADLRNGAIALASGLGAAGVGILTYEKVNTMMASSVAPPSAMAAPAAA